MLLSLLNLCPVFGEHYRVKSIFEMQLKIDFIGDISVCLHCHQETSHINQKRTLTVRDLLILAKQTVLEIEQHQYYCQDCKWYFTEEI